MNHRLRLLLVYALQCALLAVAVVVLFFPQARKEIPPLAFWLLFWLELAILGLRIWRRGHLGTEPGELFGKLTGPGGESHRITTGTLERVTFGAAFAAAAVMLFA